MTLEIPKERYAGPITTVDIGGRIKAGGETTLPFLFDEGDMPNRPFAVMEVLDIQDDPIAAAANCLAQTGLKVLCVRVLSVHPDYGSKPAADAAAVVKEISDKTGAGLIVIGSGDDDKDNELMPKVSQALKGQNALLGIAAQDNYKTLTATCLADGHSIIAESPIDVNIAKQLNILITDMGFNPQKIVIHPTTTALGYGMEYVYSIMERSRLAAFVGDKMLSMPFILFTGQEVWKVKEAKESGERQGINWEVATAVAMLQAGGDIIVCRNAETVKTVNRYIDEMMKK
jgi:acetyl-CoA decarbonylase/synthase complex subunit delta